MPETAGVEIALDSSQTGWDQFEVNEKKFGIRTDYEEELYTTRLDRSSDKYKKMDIKAKRIADEIYNVIII